MRATQIWFYGQKIPQGSVIRMIERACRILVFQPVAEEVLVYVDHLNPGRLQIQDGSIHPVRMFISRSRDRPGSNKSPPPSVGSYTVEGRIRHDGYFSVSVVMMLRIRDAILSAVVAFGKDVISAGGERKQDAPGRRIFFSSGSCSEMTLMEVAPSCARGTELDFGVEADQVVALQFGIKLLVVPVKKRRGAASLAGIVIGGNAVAQRYVNV